MRRSAIHHAVLVALGQQAAAASPPSPDSLAKFRLMPVKPGHPREPSPQRFELDRAQGICYVREADYPKLKAALARKGGPDGSTSP